jgi:rhodanese-related sulfurtransferase
MLEREHLDSTAGDDSGRGRVATRRVAGRTSASRGGQAADALAVGQWRKSMGKGFRQMVSEANAEVQTWSVADALAALGRPDVAFVDIREPEERTRDGVIPGAEPAPRGMLEFYADPDSPYHKAVFASGKTLLLYCASAGRSALAARTLKDMGLEKVAHLAGGFKAWLAAKGPAQTESTVPGGSPEGAGGRPSA